MKKDKKMDDLNKKIISYLVEKKLIMEKHIETTLLKNNLRDIVLQYDIDKNNYLKSCDEFGFEVATSTHKDLISVMFRDLEYYHNDEMRRNRISDFNLTLEKKHTEVLNDWTTFDKLF